MKYQFLRTPTKVPHIRSKYREIKTEIPAPGTEAILLDLEKYESRSMHGQLPIVWDRAEDFLVYDKSGNCWIDFTSTIFVANAGHANPHIVSSIKKLLDQKLLHTYTFANEWRAKFLKKLVEMSPSYLEKAFLLSSGTEATECAVKLMRMYGLSKTPSKLGIISFLGSMHGRTMGAEMLRGDAGGCSWIGYMDPHIYHLSFPYPWAVRNKGKTEYDWGNHFEEDMDFLRKKGINIDNVAGFMIESYIGWGAIFFPKPYIKALAKFSKEHNILIAFDDIQGGFGRTGNLFAYEYYDVDADLICLGKGMSSSLPLSAVLGRQKIMDIPASGSMSSTHSGNPLCCAAGLANLEAIESGNLVHESKRKGEILHGRLSEIKKRFPDVISYIFGKGLVAGVIIKDIKSGKTGSIFASIVCEKAMQKGLLLVHTGRESIKIGPPLTIADDALLEGLDVLEESIQEVIHGK